MIRKKINFVIFLLFVILIIVILQQYLLVNKYLELEHKKFNYNAGKNISKFFFTTPIFHKNLEKLSEKYLSSKEQLPSQEIILEKLRKGLKEYDEIDDKIDKWVEKENMKINYEHSVVVTKYSIIDTKSETVLLDFKDNNNAPVLFGNLKNQKGENVFDNMFFYRQKNHLIQLDLYVKFTGLTKYLYLQIKNTLISAFISVFLALGIFIFAAKTILKQKKLSQMKSDFIDNITHELNTPISTIGVATKNLQFDEIVNDTEKVRDLASAIKRQNDRLQKIIINVMDISFSEKGKEKLTVEDININNLLKDIVEDCRLKYKGRSFKLDEKYHKDDLVLPIDMEKMIIVFNNILDNAFKYSKEIPEISIQTEIKEKFFLIKIGDNGPGISKNDKKHIFKKFFRISEGNIHNIKGLGIGLFWVKFIIEAHNGTVTVESKKGKGTTFCISLPLKDHREEISK